MANVSEKLRTGEESDPITVIQKFQSQLLDRIIKIEKELKLLYKPYFVLAIDESDDKDKTIAVLSRLLKNGEVRVEAVTEIEKEKKTPAPYELHTRAFGFKELKELQIGFLEYEKFMCIGYINGNGDCRILNKDSYIENYELWREKGMKVCSDTVEWRGKKYWIDGDFILHSSAPFCNIYNFETCFAHKNCPDNNIFCFKHNKRPILF